jgi:methylmalonyl-CoA mutase
MNKLFNEFEPVSSRAWKQQIQVDLKGADYNDSLIWSSPEGIDVKPFYHRDQFEGAFRSVPGQPDSWQVVRSVFIDDGDIANRLIRNALANGAEAIEIVADKAFRVEELFKDVPLSKVGVYLRLPLVDAGFISELLRYLNEQQAAVYSNLDLIGNLAKTGNWFVNTEKDHAALDELLSRHPGAHLLAVDSRIYQNAGANMVQQLAYALGHANEYLNYLDGQKAPMTFSVAVGGNYFFEISKIRALRTLYAALAKEYGQHEQCHIIATPSRRNKTIYDYNMNMLRTTTECMSAVLGGANAVSNLPYDALYHKSNPFGERISRNQLLILKAESYFDQVQNPVDGTYYIESLTSALAEKALALFKEIENTGGFLKQLREGQIQKKIKEQAASEQARFDKLERILVGTNKYQNPDDRMKEQLELFPFLKREPRKTLIEPIIAKRLSEDLEKQRLDEE